MASYKRKKAAQKTFMAFSPLTRSLRRGTQACQTPSIPSLQRALGSAHPSSERGGGEARGTDRQRSIADEFRDIVLPRPLPDPPEYEREREDDRHGKGAEGGHVTGGRSVVARLREGLVMYADTWRRRPEAGTAGGLGTSEASSAEEASRLLEEVELRSATVQDIVKNKYAVRVRAFQLAVKEFVVGWHETRHRT